jgi:polyhydroxyalkanoate synthesis regulator phasin
MLEALRGYVTLAGGLTEASRRKALDTARAVLSQAPGQDGAPAQRQVQQLADELLATARSNRELLQQLVRGEVQRAAHALGLVREPDFSALSARVERLERALAATPSTAGRRAGSTQPASKRAAAKSPTTGAPAKTSTKRAAGKTSTKRAVKTSAESVAVTRSSTAPAAARAPATPDEGTASGA